MKTIIPRILFVITIAAAISACSRTGLRSSTMTGFIGGNSQSVDSTDESSEDLLPLPGQTVLDPTETRPSETEPVDDVPPEIEQPKPPTAGGWYQMSGGVCIGEPWYNGQWHCNDYRAVCIGSTSCPKEKAVAVCGFSYRQGQADFRLQPGAWEWFNPGASHLPVGWNCTIQAEPDTSGEAETVAAAFHPWVFNVKYYLANNPDLAIEFRKMESEKFYGTEWLAIQHWRNAGITEGRRASAEFSVRTYLDNNVDVKNHYGANNFARAMEHFVTYGIREGRRGN